MNEIRELGMRIHALTARLCERHSQAVVGVERIAQQYDATQWDGMERHGTVLRNRTAILPAVRALASAPKGWVVAAYRWTHRLDGQCGMGTVAAVDWEALALWVIGRDTDDAGDYEISIEPLP